MERGKVHQARRMTKLCLGNRVRYTSTPICVDYMLTMKVNA